MNTVEQLRDLLERNSGVLFLSDIPSEVYREHEALSQSELKVISEFSPAHFRYHRRCPRPDTEPMKLGRAAHIAILEPDRFDDLYMRAPDVNRSTKAGKATYEKAEQKAKELGRELLRGESYDVPLELRDAIWKNTLVKEILRGGVSERATFGYVHGVHGKALTDSYNPRPHRIADLKTTRCASRKAFEKDIRKYRYHWQAVWYTDLFEAVTGERPSFVIIAVETAPPYCSVVYEISPALMSIARKEMMEAVALYRRCMELDQWPGYPETITPVEAHGWEWEQFKKSIGESA